MNQIVTIVYLLTGIDHSGIFILPAKRDNLPEGLYISRAGDDDEHRGSLLGKNVLTFGAGNISYLTFLQEKCNINESFPGNMCGKKILGAKQKAGLKPPLLVVDSPILVNFLQLFRLMCQNL